jgi:hypothetical protein
MYFSDKRLGLQAILLTATLLLASFAQAAIPQSERDTLTAIYNSMNGNNWETNANWCVGACPLTGEPIFNAVGTECTWAGVTCDSHSSHVVGLFLSCVSGSIPDLNGLNALQTFFAGACFGIDRNFQLTGSIPELSGLPALKSFSASMHLLAGAIPSLVELTALQSIDVSYNNLTGEIPNLTGLTALQGFDASYNQLSGSIPTLPVSVGLAFDVSHNELSGVIPALPVTLEAFGAGHNKLTGSIPPLAGVTSLRVFDVDTNQLTGPLPDLSGLDLEILDVSYNVLSGSLPLLTKLPVQDFFIQGNRFSGALPDPPSTLRVCNRQDPICQAQICPNSFDLVDSDAWDLLLNISPWWASPSLSNRCDETFGNGFDWN